jgi:pimeloyl-ACP methyl ester carboxylesterase
MGTEARHLFLHGFGSDASAPIGLALVDHLATRGVALECLDLRVPSLEHLRVSQMLAVVREAIGGPDARAALIGSSLGGLVAARVAERDQRVVRLVLLAPAFRAMERWRLQIGEDAWAAWRQTGWLRIFDEAAGQRARIDHGFAEDLIAIDSTGDGWPAPQVPTLILHGQRDELIDIERSRQFAASRPHVRLVELDDGHDMMASLVAIFAEVDDFLFA